jgi:hypothetical protein
MRDGVFVTMPCSTLEQPDPKTPISECTGPDLPIYRTWADAAGALWVTLRRSRPDRSPLRGMTGDKGRSLGFSDLRQARETRQWLNYIVVQTSKSQRQASIVRACLQTRGWDITAGFPKWDQRQTFPIGHW